MKLCGREGECLRQCVRGAGRRSHDPTRHQVVEYTPYDKTDCTACDSWILLCPSMLVPALPFPGQVPGSPFRGAPLPWALVAF